MLWLHHPKFVPVRDTAINAVIRDEYRFRRTRAIIFLCGGQDSLPRERLALYLRKRARSLVFYAEQVWNVIAQKRTLNALEMEEQLAQLADVVIVIVESPGTMAELGAFALSPDLRSKLLPILHKDHQTAESFINTGPVSWVDADSMFAPCVWVDLDSILEAAGPLHDRLNLISTKPARRSDLISSPKHLLFFVCDLVAIFGPCPAEHVDYYLNQVFGQSPDMTAITLLELAYSMDLLDKVTGDAGIIFYLPLLRDGELQSYHYTKKFLGVPTLRAQVLSTMQVMDSGRVALALMKDRNGSN